MRKKLVLTLITLSILTAAMLTMAPGTPPPDDLANCSPGFWKNHTEYWLGDYGPNDPYPFNPDITVLDALQGGKDTRVSRVIVAGYLNSFYSLAESPCGD